MIKNQLPPPNSKEKVKSVTSNITDPTVKNNSLAFNSRDDFNGFIGKLSKEPSGNLNTFTKKKAPSFTSLKQRKDIVKRSKRSKTKRNVPRLNIEDPLFASVVSEDGVLQIGKRVFLITNRYTYIFKNRKAFKNFNLTKNKRRKINTIKNKLAPLPCNRRKSPEQYGNDGGVYRVENCGSTGPIGGGGSDGSDDDDKYTDPSDLDIRANPAKHYPKKRTQEYRSGGTKGRLKGKTWHRDYWVYESIGVKSVHERHTWLRWWNRAAEKITLESYANYSYGESNLSKSQLTKSFKVTIKGVTQLIPGGVNSFLQNIFSLAIGDKLTQKLWDAADNKEITLISKKIGENKYNYNVIPTSDYERSYSKVKYNAKKIRHVYDISTAIFSTFPPFVDDKIDFKINVMRTKHTLKHDGYNFGFITGRRN